MMNKREAAAIANWVSDRTPRPLCAPQMAFDLAKESELLRQEAPWLEHGHNARTMIKDTQLRLLLIVMRTGAEMAGQRVDAPLAVHVLRGQLEVEVDGQRKPVEDNGLWFLEANRDFGLHAVKDAEFLLWLGWSGQE